MIRLLFFVLVFLLAPFAKVQANTDVQNCAIPSVPANQKKTENILGKSIFKLKQHPAILTQSDIENEADAVNERDELFIILHIWSSALRVALEKAEHNQEYFSSDVSAILPAKYLLYHQLKIPFS